MRLTPHFLLEEFTLSSTALAHGIDNTPTARHMTNLRKLAERMEEVRSLFDAVITITSGYRNPRVNALVKGSPTSAHALGLAADFHVHGFTDLQAAKRIRDSELEFDQLIYEKNRCVHLGIGPGNGRRVQRQPGGPRTRVFNGLEE